MKMPATLSRRARWAAWLLGLPAVLLIAAALLLVYFPWDSLRPYLSREVSTRLGRNFEMRGPLQVELGWQTRIVAHELYLENANWSAERQMAKLGSLDLTLDLPALLDRRIELTGIKLAEADVLLERDPQHGGNWQFGPAKTSAQSPSSWQLLTGPIALREGRLRFLDPAANTALAAQLGMNEGPSAAVEASVDGRYRGLPLAVTGRVGLPPDWRNPASTYPLSAQGQVGDTHFEGSGSVSEPARLAGLNLDFALRGRSLAELYTILGLPLPATPAYRLQGRLQHHAQVWQLQDFSGKVGGSDLAGTFRVDRASQPQAIVADLVSKRLDLKDLSGFIGARAANGAPAPQPAGKVLPHGQFNLDKLNAADMDVHFSGQHIATGKLPFESLQAHLKLKAGQLQLDPVALGVAGGRVVGAIRLDARQAAIRTHADLTLERLQLSQLFPQIKLQKANVGALGGRLSLATQGNSIADMLGQADGKVTLLMNGGAISKLLLRLSNLDLANTLLILLAGDEQVPVNCLAAELPVRRGDMQVETLLLDTTKQLVLGEGRVDLRNEKLDIRLRAKPRDASLVALRGPIQIDGTFAHPVVRPQLGQATGRLAFSALLAGVAGPLALVPLVQLRSGDTENHCTGLSQRLQSQAGTRPKVLQRAAAGR